MKIRGREVKPVRKKRRFGIAEWFLILAIGVVVSSVAIYHITGVGRPPSVDITPVVRDNFILLVVTDGRIPASDWEYLVFDERLNPPVVWVPAPADMEPGAEIVLKSNLIPSTYRVQIRHIPTAKFILNDKVTIK